MKKIVLILSAFGLILSMADAATVRERISYALSKYDTINVVRMEDTVLIDSTWYLPNGTGHDSTHFDTTLSVDNTKNTIIDTKIMYVGSDEWQSFTWPYAKAATAAVSYADITTIGDTLVARATAAPGVFYGPGLGSGAYTVRVYAIDTSGTDDSLYKADISIQTITGVAHLGPIATNSNGYVDFSLDADSFRVLIAKEGYQFTMDTIVVAANQTNAITGRNYVVGSPSAADVSKAYAWCRDASGNIIPGAKIIAIPVGGNIQDTCASTWTTIVRQTLESAPSDADSGFAYINLTKSKCYNRQNKYKISIVWNNDEIFGPKVLTVPDSSTWLLTDQ